MFSSFKKLLFILFFNSFLFLFMIIGIQNSSKKSEVDLIVEKTVSLPISFIVSVSFISGSMIGSLLTINFTNKD